LLLIAHNRHADRTPFSPGANDNATGAGLVLTLAENLLAAPLLHTRVWLVNTGCEEVQHYGAADFYRRHQPKLRAPVAVAFEMLGCTNPAWATWEGIIIPFQADRRLVAIAEELAAKHPEWRARGKQSIGGNSEMSDALLAGIPAIALLGSAGNGETAYWHQMEDTYDKMDPEAMARAYAFVWTLIRALDVQAGV
jgi:Zn-dependent M28 family amino/carboxypeptidase